MTSKQMKIKLVAAIAFVAFLGVVVFGFIFMMNINMHTDHSAASECPRIMFSGGTCPQSALDAAVHHISIYQLFTNAPINFGIMASMISLLFAMSAILAIFINLALLVGQFALAGIFYNSPLNTSYKRKVTHWLALHENSPAFL
mgnify:FL=1